MWIHAVNHDSYSAVQEGKKTVLFWLVVEVMMKSGLLVDSDLPRDRQL